ncbi:unnamed protein product [Jaminaea pallidilutea]
MNEAAGPSRDRGAGAVINERSPLLAPSDRDTMQVGRGQQDPFMLEETVPPELSLPLAHPSARSRRTASVTSIKANFDVEDTADPESTAAKHVLSPSTLGRSSRYLSATRVAFIQDGVGLGYLLLSCLCTSGMTLSYTLLTRIDANQDRDGDASDAAVSPFQIIFVRMSFTWLASISTLFILSDPNPILGPPGVRALLCLRGVIGFFGLAGLYYSLQYLSLSDATTLTFLSPTLVGILCYLFLGEPFKSQELGAGLVSLLGVLMIARPKSLFGSRRDGLTPPEAPSLVAHGDNKLEQVTEAQRMLAVGVALIGVLGASGAYTTIRAIGTRAPALHSVSFFAFYSALVSFLTATLRGETWTLPPSHRTRAALLLLSCAVLGFVSQFLLARGLQLVKGARASTTMYTTIFWSTLFQLVFLGDPVSPLSAVGCLIILSSAFYIALSK